MTLQALKPRPESRRTAGRPGGQSDPGLSRPGQLVDPVGLRTWTPVTRDSWSTPRALGWKCVWPRTAGQKSRTYDQGASHPGKLFDTAGPKAQSRVTRDTWLTPRALRHGPESPQRAGQPWALGPRPKSPGNAGIPRGPSAPSAKCPGQLVDPVGPRTRARVAQGSLATPRALGYECESPGTSDRP